MNVDDLFEVWAPRESLWSPWVKPVLFSFCGQSPERNLIPAVEIEPDYPWLHQPWHHTAMVIDLPGVDSVRLGMRFARAGFRPVPLFNAVPAATPRVGGFGCEVEATPMPVVEVGPIIRALIAATPQLKSLSLDPGASPVFLLDSRRREAKVLITPGMFDNRSISFPTDFPSANFLLAHGIKQAVIVQQSGDQPQSDLAHTLRAWQAGHLEILLKALDVDGDPIKCEVARPSRYRLWFYRALEMLGFQRNVLGGFGGVLPDPSAG